MAAVRLRRVRPGEVGRLRYLHDLLFPVDHQPDFTAGTWFLALSGNELVGFAGFQLEPSWPGAAYLCRAGVMPQFTGRGLQRRLIRVRERAARAQGLTRSFTTTYENPASANNLIREGYSTYLPAVPWGAPGTIYWRKTL
jgi:GNAT superfamily N-acetyltransferase